MLKKALASYPTVLTQRWHLISAWPSTQLKTHHVTTAGCSVRSLLSIWTSSQPFSSWSGPDDDRTFESNRPPFSTPRHLTILPACGWSYNQISPKVRKPLHLIDAVLGSCENMRHLTLHHGLFDQHDVPTSKGEQWPSRVVLYKGRWIIPIQVVVRLKVFQLAGVAGLAVPMATFLTEGTVEPFQLLLAGSVVFGCGMAAVTLWYFSRRYVGELSVINTGDGSLQLCFSVLDFWGRRENNVVDVHALIPPFKEMSAGEIASVGRQPLVPLDVEGDRQYIISLRQGLVQEPHLLKQLLSGQALTLPGCHR
eukprot:jgi/Botrbrau1/15751/Bobra.4_1s0117.2